jgi:hypothetical protein
MTVGTSCGGAKHEDIEVGTSCEGAMHEDTEVGSPCKGAIAPIVALMGNHREIARKNRGVARKGATSQPPGCADTTWWRARVPLPPPAARG